MTTAVDRTDASRMRDLSQHRQKWGTAFGYAKNLLGNRFVYVVVSPRAHGLSVGVNMNPSKRCNFDCVYCEVDRSVPPRDQKLEVSVMVEELGHTLQLAVSGELQSRPGFQSLPPELLELRHVALSGDSEPTLSCAFREAIHSIVHLRALGKFPFFKLVLISNATALDIPQVQLGLQCLTPSDEIWLKLDGGTQKFVDRINRPKVPLDRVLDNILMTGKQRPIVIQSLFARFNDEEPPAPEIDQFVARLRELKEAGAKISLVQIYSAMRPTTYPLCGHLSLKSLSRIAQIVRAGTGLAVEVF